MMQEPGLAIGASSACVFYNSGAHLVASVHWVDFATTGPKSALDKFVNDLKTMYDLKEAAGWARRWRR